MSRKYNIRWKQHDSEELARAVKNFNAKLRRLEIKHPELKNVLPEKASVRQLKELIETRQDLKRELNALKRFSKKGSEEIVDVPGSDYNLKITKWQKEEMTRRVGIINRKRKQRLKEVMETPLTSRGEELGYKKGDIGMGKAEEVALTPMRTFTARMNRRDIKHKFKQIMVESQTTYWSKRDILLKENYIKSLEENFNPNDIREIADTIRDMDYNEFKKIFDSEGGLFELSYPPSKREEEQYLSALNAVWRPNKAPTADSRTYVNLNRKKTTNGESMLDVPTKYKQVKGK